MHQSTNKRSSPGVSALSLSQAGAHFVPERCANRLLCAYNRPHPIKLADQPTRLIARQGGPVAQLGKLGDLL
jgi:hypothetical protein